MQRAWTPRRAARRLVAVPWRHPGLIALCALAGAIGAGVLSQRHPAPAVAAQGPRVGTILQASRPQGAGVPGREDVEALLNRAPPAADRTAAPALAGAPTVASGRGRSVVPGLVAGLLLGLLAAAARELRGDRMRSAREAERALGAPVLGAVPTLSGRARRALLASAARRGSAGPR